MKKIGFIGAGNMGGAIITAACKQLDPQEVVIYDLDAKKAGALSAETGCVVGHAYADVICDVETVMLCVKPQFLEGVLNDVMPLFKAEYDKGRRQVVGSIVAAYELDVLTKRFGDSGMEMPVIRLMPNTPVTIGQGVILFANNGFAADSDVEQMMEQFQKGGLCKHTSERTLSVACPVFSCSPAFVYMFIEAMADGGVQIGLFRDQAIELAAQAVLGSAAMVLQSGKHPAQLKDAVCSPGGITIVGVSELEKHGFRDAAIQAVVKAFERQEEMSK